MQKPDDRSSPGGDGRDASTRLRLGDGATLVLLALVLFPFVWLVQMSFRPNTDILGYELAFTPDPGALPRAVDRRLPRLLRQQPGDQHRLDGARPADRRAGRLSLSRGGFRSSRSIALWILATRMAPPIAFTIPFFLAYRFLGLSDTRTGLILIYLTFNLALVIWMMKPYFDSVPRELEEAAWIDGCGIWSAFWRVTLPLSSPGLAATAVICFILSWNDFFYALILTRTQASTAPVAIVNFIQYTGWEWGRIAAAGTLVMLPVVAFSILVRNYLVRGLAAGGVKE